MMLFITMTDSKKANTIRPDFILDLGPGLSQNKTPFFLYNLKKKLGDGSSIISHVTEAEMTSAEKTDQIHYVEQRP